MDSDFLGKIISDCSDENVKYQNEKWASAFSLNTKNLLRWNKK